MKAFLERFADWLIVQAVFAVVPLLAYAVGVLARHTIRAFQINPDHIGETYEYPALGRRFSYQKLKRLRGG